VVCYACYIFYTREPDYFDGEITTAMIKVDSSTQSATAVFDIMNKTYLVDASYPLRKLNSNQKVNVIYKVSEPETAVVYSFWGYWFKWGELLMSSILLIALFYLSVSITNNPSPESLYEQQNYVETPQRKYS
jgi:hypothetical protein